MRIYYIETDYINYLRQFDSHVMLNKSHRPYVGVVLRVHGVDYFAPFETAKTNKRVNNQLTFKIWDKRPGLWCRSIILLTAKQHDPSSSGFLKNVRYGFNC